MNLTLFGAIAFVAFVSDSTAQFGPPGFVNLFASPAANSGWAIGQESSKNGMNIAINNAISSANSTELPPELQSELQMALAESELALTSCDEYLLLWTMWRYKICKFQVLSKLKLKIQEIKMKAQQYATSTTQATTTFQSSSAVTQSSSVAA